MKNDSFKLSFENRGTYLYAYLTGQDSFAACLDYWNLIADKANELGHKKVLVHEKMTGAPTEGEIDEVAKDVIAYGLAGIQIAFFDENPANTTINEAGQSLSADHGIHTKIFPSLEAARHWIENTPGSSNAD